MPLGHHVVFIIYDTHGHLKPLNTFGTEKKIIITDLLIIYRVYRR